MRIFRGRPLALAVCVSVLLSVFALKWQGGIKLTLCFFALAAFLFLLIRSVKKRCCSGVVGAAMLSLLFCFAVLLESWLFFDRSVSSFEEKAQNGCTVEGYVTERLSDSGYERRFVAELDEINGERTLTRVWIELAYPSSLQIGERFRLFGTLRAAQDSEFYPESVLMLADGSVGILRCESAADCSVLSDGQNGLFLRFKKWNFALSERLRQAVGGEAGDLAAAFLLGNREGLSGDTELDFQRSGISHLLALSGMHISAVILILEFLLKRLWIPKRVRAFLVPVAALFYLGLTGCSLSTARAVLMTCMVYLAFLLAEDVDPFTSLCTALAVSVLSAPYAILDASLWLSFSAAAGIVIFLPAVHEYFQSAEWVNRLPHWIAMLLSAFVLALAVGLLANAALLAFLAYFFGEASVFSVPVTLLLSPVLLPVLFLCALSLAIPQCVPVTALTRGSLNGMLWFAEQVSDIRYGTVKLDGTLTVILLAALVISLVGLATVRLKRMRWLALPILLSVAVMTAGYCDVLPTHHGVAVSYLRLEDEEVILLTEGRSSVAVDLSNGSSNVAATILSMSGHDRFTELDELVFTRYYSKMPYFLSAISKQIKLRAIRLPDPATREEAALAARISQEAELHGIAVLAWDDPFALPSAELLTTARTPLNAVVWSVRIGENELTYLDTDALKGDAYPIALQAILSSHTVILSAKAASDSCVQALWINERTEQWIFSDFALYQAFQSRFSGFDREAGVGSCRFFLK